MIRVFTDGGCRGNPGPGAWAYLIVTEQGRTHRSGFELLTTNNVMELTAAIRALEYLKAAAVHEQPEISTDSQYLMRGITEWLPRWKQRHWYTASGEPVKNQDLWEALDSLNLHFRPRWLWVRGHRGHPENEFCDRLVNECLDLHLGRQKAVPTSP